MEQEMTLILKNANHRHPERASSLYLIFLKLFRKRGIWDSNLFVALEVQKYP